MNQDELISELLQALTNDVQNLQRQVAKHPPNPGRTTASIEKITQARAGTPPATGQTYSHAAADLKQPANIAFTRMENQIRRDLNSNKPTPRLPP
jgi:hypothetical protein